MKLSLNDRKELRRKIEERIKHAKISSNEKIHLDKKTLEMLLFEVCETKDGENYKFLVWTGPVLSKIDLDGISFTNVVWNPNDETLNKFKLTAIKRDYLDNVYVKNLQELNYAIYLANTNARINFCTSYEYKSSDSNSKYLALDKCNFENTDLSKSNINIFDAITDSNLAHTGAIITIDNQNFTNTNLSYLNLRGNTVSEKAFLGTIYDGPVLYNTKLTNTEIKVDFDIKTATRESLLILGQLIKKGYLTGCTVNNVYLKNSEELNLSLKKLQTEYNSLKSSILAQVDKEIKRVRNLKD